MFQSSQEAAGPIMKRNIVIQEYMSVAQEQFVIVTQITATPQQLQKYLLYCYWVQPLDLLSCSIQCDNWHLGVRRVKSVNNNAVHAG